MKVHSFIVSRQIVKHYQTLIVGETEAMTRDIGCKGQGDPTFLSRTLTIKRQQVQKVDSLKYLGTVRETGSQQHSHELSIQTMICLKGCQSREVTSNPGEVTPYHLQQQQQRQHVYFSFERSLFCQSLSSTVINIFHQSSRFFPRSYHHL